MPRQFLASGPHAVHKTLHGILVISKALPLFEGGQRGRLGQLLSGKIRRGRQPLQCEVGLHLDLGQNSLSFVMANVRDAAMVPAIWPPQDCGLAAKTESGLARVTIRKHAIEQAFGTHGAFLSAGWPSLAGGDNMHFGIILGKCFFAYPANSFRASLLPLDEKEAFLLNLTLTRYLWGRAGGRIGEGSFRCLRKQRRGS